MLAQNTSAFWELLGAITALNPPRNEQAKLYAQFESLGLSLRGFGFDPNTLPDSTISGQRNLQPKCNLAA